MSHLQYPVPRARLNRLAEALSYLLHPAVLMLLTVGVVSWRTRGGFGWALLDVGILLAGVLPGLLYVYIRTKQGHFSHYHLLLKEERYSVLPLLLAGALASFGLYALTQAPTVMLQAMVVGLLAGLGAILISRFWKISLHAAVAMGCAALLIPWSWLAVAIFLLLGLIAGLARLRVRHHTTAQVLAGWLYGFATGSLLMVWLRIS